MGKKNAPTGNFDFVAPVYDRLAKGVFGKAIKEAQIQLLKEIPDQGEVLVLGGGSGWIIPEIFHKSNPNVVHYIDASAKMIELSRQHLQLLPVEKASKVKLIHGTQEAILPSHSYHTIICFFFFDLFSQPEFEILFQQLDSILLNQGKFLVADFWPNGGNFFHHQLVNLMYVFFGMVAGLKNQKLPAVEEIFVENAYEKEKQFYHWHGLIQSTVWQKGIID